MGCKLSKVDQPSTFIGICGSIDLSPADNQAFTLTVRKQRQSSIDNTSYRKAIDKWRPSSIEELVRSIKKLARRGNQIDRAWIIFYWISQNISYDITTLNNRNGSQNANAVFESKRAVCEGYALIYADLCQQTGIQCRKVSGYSKGSGFVLRQTKFEKTDHAWNIITLDNGHSYFIESTWGSGHSEQKTNQFKAELVSHYFMCPPEHMIYQHLPEDPSCQLLANPITMNEFLMLPRVYSTFFTSNLQIISPVDSNRIALIENQSYGEVLIRTSNNNTILCGSLVDGKNIQIEGASFLYSDKNDSTLWRCQFAPPEAGKYTVEIYAGKKQGNTRSYSIAVEFVFDVTCRLQSPISFPFTWSEFFEYNLEIIKPKNTRFIDWPSHARNGYGEILIRSPPNVYLSAHMVDTSTDTEVQHATLMSFNHELNLWQCFFVPPQYETPYDIILFASYLNEVRSHSTAKLSLLPVTKSNLKHSMVFPEVYYGFTENKVQLIEPLNGVLRKGSIVHFRCRIPGAQAIGMIVDGNWSTQDEIKPDENDVFDTNIQVGRNHVSICIKMNVTDRLFHKFLNYTVS
ncbi:hypothetical protein I4U23_020933 [Adineta vaga]|nr:hypothetical protein I4U23_020933 [Adineta vaga]